MTRKVYMPARGDVNMFVVIYNASKCTTRTDHEQGDERISCGKGRDDMDRWRRETPEPVTTIWLLPSMSSDRQRFARYVGTGVKSSMDTSSHYFERYS